MRGVLVDDHQPVNRLRHDIGLVHLRARRAERLRDQVGLRRECFDPHIRRRPAGVERRLRDFGQPTAPRRIR
jgi:hypothetical protein